MKNVSTLKSSTTDSPKTPGGISKSLLTPCRRVGLSRNFRKSGATPFQSPLSSKTEVKEEKVETRKRKEYLEDTPQTPENADNVTSESNQTPTRNVELPRRKRSKTLLAAITKTCEENNTQEESLHEKIKDSVPDKNIRKDEIGNQEPEFNEVTTPLRLKSKSRSKKNVALSKSISKESPVKVDRENIHSLTKVEKLEATPLKNTKTIEDPKEKSPNNLTKECIVVIQNKIFKKEFKQNEMAQSTKELHEKCSTNAKVPVSQVLFDSDSDDMPLICLNKANDSKHAKIEDDDDDFAVTKTKIAKPEKSISKTKLKSPSSKPASNSKLVKMEINKVPISQSTVDEDDDFFEKKKTILIRKTYDKVVKPQKAKSTGSITQKDIEDLKARIEVKKKLLLARSMKEDTKELRDLIKKWQKGCQDALMELMDLMKSKFPDKQNMDYSEILQTLNIPSSIVGYDSDNDCFLTPDDESIVLAKF